ncbi:MAG TPA: hypothetical protein VGL29_16910 [Blastocatellia bacterium]|jgi:hypothetical protein
MIPSGSTRLTVAFFYTFPLLVLMSSASAIDADNAAKIANQCFTRRLCSLLAVRSPSVGPL